MAECNINAGTREYLVTFDCVSFATTETDVNQIIQTTEGYVPVEKSGKLVNSAIEETVDKIIMTKVLVKYPSDYYYFGDENTPVLNDFRFFIDGIFLRTQRYDGSDWQDIVVDGGSTSVNRILEIVKDVNAELLVNDNGDIRNLIRSASFSDGTIVGDVGGDMFLTADDKIYKTKKIETNSWKVIQPNDSQNSTGTSFYVDHTTLPVDGFVSEAIKVSGVGLPSGLKSQLKIYLQSDLVNPVWENVTDEELASGNGVDVDESTGEIQLIPKFYGVGSTDVRLEINFSEEVTLKGSTTDGTDIYFESFDATVEFREITDNTNVVTQLESKTGDDRLDFNSLKNTPAPVSESFTDLEDTPANYTGESGKFVVVKSAEDGLEFTDSHPSIKEKFTDLSDTPSDHNTTGIENVVNNPFTQSLEYREAQLSDNKDVEISAPASGEILLYDELNSKWINDEPRVHLALQSYTPTITFDDWGDNPVSYLFVSDNNIVPIDTPSTPRELDVIGVYNFNTEFGKYIELSARAGETINGASSYQIDKQKVAFFKFDNSKDWKLVYEGNIVSDLAAHSVTQLSDVTNAGSGAIITSAERAKLNNLIPVSEPIVVTADLVITSGNYETYNNVVVEGQKTLTTLVVDLPVISTLPTERVIFSFTNRSPDNSSLDVRAGAGDDINGAFFQRLKVGESIVIEKPSAGTSWLIISEVIDRKPCYITDNKAVSIPIDCNNVFVKYTDFDIGSEIVQTLPALNTIGSGLRLYFQNADTDKTHSVRVTPDGSETIDGQSEFEIAGNVELAEFISDVDNDNWILANLHYDVSAIHSDLEIDDGTTSIGAVTKITLNNGKITGTADNVDWTPRIVIKDSDSDLKTNEIQTSFPLEVSEISEGVTQLGITPGTYERQHAPGYYASLNDDVEVVGRKSTGVRTGKLWFDNVIKPEGPFIDIDRNNKRIGLEEDDTLDPNITGGTAYLIFYRTAFKGTAAADGYIQISLVDATTGDIIEDDNGQPIAVRKEYKTDDKLGALELTAIKKYTGIEYFQMVVEENFDGEELVIEDRTEGNSCILIQALNTNDQTSRGLLQMENDVGVNIEWTSHYLGDDLFTVRYFLQEDRPFTTITAGTGETGADGWHFYNFTQLKVGIASDTLTIEDDGAGSLVGFSFGKVISAEKTQLLRGKVLNTFITTTTPEGAGRVYGAKWTGTPDEYTKNIITDIDPAGDPVMAANWELLGTSIFCTEDASGNPNTYSGAFTVPSDAENFATIFVPSEKQNPNKFEITDFYANVATPFNGYFIHAPEIEGERHLVEDTKYFESGLNTEGYASLRYTINSADTPMPAGKLIKGKADITANWAGTGGAVDYLTFNESGDATVSTTFNVYPGESISSGGTATVNFWWAYKQGGSWIKIDESEVTHTAIKDVPVPQLVTIPAFTYKAKTGDELRCFASASINDGAYIQTTSPHIYLCQTTINFQEFIPGSADEPLTTLYVQDELDNDWELTAGTDGRLRTLLVDDLPENINKHTIQTDFSGNDFNVTGDVITLVDKKTKQEYTEINTNTDLDDYRNYIVDTTSNTVTINIPYEQETAFTVRDWKKKFDVNNCIITIRDALDAIIHTATLNKKDKGYIFYFDGTIWKYGEIGKGIMVDIASDHTASTDFGDLVEENDTYTCVEFKGMTCYENVTDMGTNDNDLAHKKYVDDNSGISWNTPIDNSITVDTDSTYSIGYNTNKLSYIYTNNLVIEDKIIHNEDLDTYIDFNDNEIILRTGGNYSLNATSTGVTLQSGTNVNEFSIDGTLAGDSDDAVPTEKAVKKYVDDNSGTVVNKMTVTPTAHIENLDVSSLSPFGILFVDNTVNYELKSLAGGSDGDVIQLVHINTGDLKLKRSDGYTGQQLQMPNDADDTLTKYGGCTLVYNSSKGYWFVTGLYY